MNIPILDLQSQYASIKPEIDGAVTRVINSGRFIGGPEVAAFEQEIAAFLGAKHAIGCASGTDALQLALMAIGLKPGDEVITPSFTFVATAEAIALLGGVPVFVDIDPRTFTVDAALLEKKITARTKAILPVHLYGHPSAMDAINAIAKAHHIPVIEDAAQSIGARYHGRRACTLGDIACVSFYPTKNLGAFGDGGLLVTDSDEHAATLRKICNHGQFKTYHYDAIGVNSRLDALQAAILRVKLRHLDRWNEERRRIAAVYTKLFEGTDVVPPWVSPDVEHVYHQYTVRVPNRDAVARTLAAQGISNMIYYPVPLHVQEAYTYLGGVEGDFPATESAASEVLSLPMYPELSDEQIAHVARGVIDAVTTVASPA